MLAPAVVLFVVFEVLLLPEAVSIALGLRWALLLRGGDDVTALAGGAVGGSPAGTPPMAGRVGDEALCSTAFGGGGFTGEDGAAAVTAAPVESAPRLRSIVVEAVGGGRLPGIAARFCGNVRPFGGDPP